MAHAAVAHIADKAPADYEAQLSAALIGQAIPPTVVEDLNSDLKVILGKVLELARTVCETVSAGGPKNCHTRTDSKRYSKLMAQTRLLKQALGIAASLRPAQQADTGRLAQPAQTRSLHTSPLCWPSG